VRLVIEDRAFSFNIYGGFQYVTGSD
jgi:hypothetical protein